MPMQKNLCGELRRFVPGRVLHEKFAEQKYLLSQSARARVVREQIAQLVPKHGSAARLEHDDRQPSVNFRTQDIHDLFQVSLGPGEHSEVIQRTSTTQNIARAFHSETRVLQNFESGAARLWMKIIVERIDPQQYFLLFRPGRFLKQCRPRPLCPSPKIEVRKSGQLTLRREPQHQSERVPKSRRTCEKVCHRRSQRGPPRPSIDHPKGVCPQWSPLGF